MDTNRKDILAAGMNVVILLSHMNMYHDHVFMAFNQST